MSALVPWFSAFLWGGVGRWGGCRSSRRDWERCARPCLCSGAARPSSRARRYDAWSSACDSGCAPSGSALSKQFAQHSFNERLEISCKKRWEQSVLLIISSECLTNSARVKKLFWYLARIHSAGIVNCPNSDLVRTQTVQNRTQAVKSGKEHHKIYSAPWVPSTEPRKLQGLYSHPRCDLAVWCPWHSSSSEFSCRRWHSKPQHLDLESSSRSLRQNRHQTLL